MDLKRAFQSGFRYLDLRNRQAFLSRPNAQFAPAAGREDELALAMRIDLADLYSRFRLLVPDEDRVYSSPEVAKAAGVSHVTPFHWLRDGLIRATHGYTKSANLGGIGFGWSHFDVFIASLAGVLRRYGLPLNLVRQITTYLYDGDLPADAEHDRSGTAAKDRADLEGMPTCV